MKAAPPLIKRLADTRLSVRLTILVAVALGAAVIIAYTGMKNNQRLALSIKQSYGAIIRPMAAVANARGEFNFMRTGLYDLAQDFNTSQDNLRFKRQIMRSMGAYEHSIMLYQSILEAHGTRDPYEAEAVEYLYGQLGPLRHYVEHITKVAEQTGRGADAVLLLRGDFLKAGEDIARDLLALTDILEEQAHQANLYAEKLRRYNDFLSLAMTALAALFLLAIAFVIVKSVTGPMGEMAALAERLSEGKLDVHIGYRAKNEMGILADSFRNLTQSVTGIISDLNQMAGRQSGGDINHFIDAAPYQGGYRDMADGINNMMRVSLNDLKTIIRYLGALAKGDFSARLEPFPGGKSVINHSIDEIYKNLASVHADIDSLLTSALGGKLGARVDEEGYAGDWRGLMEGLNGLLNAVVAPINEAAEVLSLIAKGDLSARMVGDYKGDMARIKEAVNGAGQGLEAFLNDKLAAERAAYLAQLDKSRAEAATEAILSSIHYAGTIQKSLRPADEAFQRAFSDYSVIWSPRDIVGGDIYWLKSYNEGSILCVCDCTGHGTPGALLTMLVASALESSVDENNYKDTAEIMWRLDQRLAAVLNVNSEDQALLNINDGCDVAVVYIDHSGRVTISSAGIHVFICDGAEVEQIRGQRLYIGEGALSGPGEVKVITIDPSPDNAFYIASDGLYDQIGGEKARPYGYREFKNIILENHQQTQKMISEKIWRAFELYRGSHLRRDDVELITFRP